MTHTEYTEFFRDIASRHKEIRHSAHDMHFARLILSNDPFLPTTAQLNDFLDSVKNKLQGPAMLLSSYEAQYSDNRSDNVEKMIAGRLIIIDEVKPINDFDKEEEVLSRTERIGEECLGFAEKIFCEWPERGFFEWDAAASEKVAKLTSRNFFGTGFNFAIKYSAQQSVVFNADQFDLTGIQWPS